MASVLHHIHHAVVAFDSDLNLTFANRAYRTLLGLPEDLVRPGTHFSEISKHLIKSGVYGDVDPEAELAKWVGRAAAPEDRTDVVTRPSGITFSIEKTVLPEGGFVLTYVDVTDLKSRERELADKSEFMEAILQNTATGVIIFDSQLNLLVANQGVMDLYGFEPELAKPGTPIERFAESRLRRGYIAEHDIIDGDLNRQVEARVAHFRSFPVGKEMIFTETLPDGRIVEVRRLNSSFGALISTYTDITERVRAAEAVKTSENRYRAIVEDQNDMICRYGPDLRLIFVNGAYQRAFGGDGQDLLGLRFLDLIPDPETRKIIENGVSGLSVDNPVLTGFYPERTAAGEKRWHFWTNRAIFDENGEVVEYQAVGRDETDRHLAELALRESERRFRSIVEDQSEMITRFGRDLVLTFANRAYSEYIETDRSNIVGRPVTDFVPKEAEALFSRTPEQSFD